MTLENGTIAGGRGRATMEGKNGGRSDDPPLFLRTNLPFRTILPLFFFFFFLPFKPFHSLRLNLPAYSSSLLILNSTHATVLLQCIFCTCTTIYTVC